MFPPLVSTRSGSKSQHLKDAISTGNTGPPTILAIKFYSKHIITETFILTNTKYGNFLGRSETKKLFFKKIGNEVVFNIIEVLIDFSFHPPFLTEIKRGTLF